MSISDIIKEIQQEKFDFERKYLVELIHDNSWEKGYILNFRKKDL